MGRARSGASEPERWRWLLVPRSPLWLAEQRASSARLPSMVDGWRYCGSKSAERTRIPDHCRWRNVGWLSTPHFTHFTGGSKSMTQVSAVRDLRELIGRLEERGQLYRFTEPINKETELFPLFRVQQRGLPDAERKALLFENVVGAKGERYEMPCLVGAYGASDAIALTGLDCETYVEALERWHEAREHPMNPVVVDQGPVQEHVLVGDELKNRGLDIFPAPLEDPGLSGMIRVGMPMITRDPETGVRNLGTYNAFFKARDRMQAAIGPN